MASAWMHTDLSSLATSRLSHKGTFLPRLNGAFLHRRCIGQLSFRTTASRTVSIRSSSTDAAKVIDDMAMVTDIILKNKTEVSRMKESIGAIPGLAVIFVGDTWLWESYDVSCRFAGIKSSVVHLAEDSPDEEVLKSVSRFNDDPSVHGIVVTLPLPSHMDEQNILNAVSVEKDVQGFNPLNIARLAIRGEEPLFVPPTPKGCIELLKCYNIEIKGKKAVVIGRSNTFGMPTALLLQREDATVTIIHSRTKNPEEITRQADIVISAVGKANLVRGSWIKPGAVIINVGTTLVTDPNDPYGYGLAGDICY